MRSLLSLIALIASLFTTASANTEKVIFRAPAKSKLPDSKPGIDFLNIESLSAQADTLRTSLAVNFTSSAQPNGVDHWYLLRGLQEKQRHELRVCWSATQPTRFTLDVHTISNVFDEAHLIQNLAKVVQRPEPRAAHTGNPEALFPVPGTYDSVLYLHIQAAADYFSTNKTLMQHPPAVLVDIILDPYLGNVFPRSLLPTTLYLMVLALLGWLVSHMIWIYLKPTTTSKPHQD